MARIARADVGPLAAYADGYRGRLAGLGYTPGGVVQKLCEVGRLSDWMTANGLASEDLSAERISEFSALCAGGPPSRRHREHRWLLVHMIEEYARHCGHADLPARGDRRRHRRLTVADTIGVDECWPTGSERHRDAGARFRAVVGDDVEYASVRAEFA